MTLVALHAAAWDRGFMMILAVIFALQTDPAGTVARAREDLRVADGQRFVADRACNLLAAQHYLAQFRIEQAENSDWAASRALMEQIPAAEGEAGREWQAVANVLADATDLILEDRRTVAVKAESDLRSAFNAFCEVQ